MAQRCHRCAIHVGTLAVRLVSRILRAATGGDGSYLAGNQLLSSNR